MKQLLTICSFLFLLLICCCTACTKKELNTTRAFYYWKSTETKLSTPEQEALQQLQTAKLYVKFFEVEPDSVQKAIATVKTQLHIHSVAIPKEIVPTIFIRNELWKNVDVAFCTALSEKIIRLCEAMHKAHFPNTTYEELQIDCDWTPSTKELYFELLKALKAKSKKRISCTLRLYPYKYPHKMGVPPVDRAMLMCYNLIGPLENLNKNSILDLTELKPYLNNKKAYPLPLDIALPIFFWLHLYQNERFVGLITPKDSSIKNLLTQKSELWYQFNCDTVIGDYYLRKGDRAKYEKISAALLQDAIKILRKNLIFKDDYTIALFHLEEANLKQYHHETINNFFTAFNF